MTTITRWVVFGTVITFAAIAAATVLTQLSPVVPDPRCDSADLLNAYSIHAAQMRVWLFEGDVVVAIGAGLTVTVFLYLQLTHHWPYAVAVITNIVAIMFLAAGAGSIALRSAQAWAQSNAQSCLSETLVSPQASNSSYLGQAVSAPPWGVGVFADASVMCLFGMTMGFLFYFAIQRSARA